MTIKFKYNFVFILLILFFFQTKTFAQKEAHKWVFTSKTMGGFDSNQFRFVRNVSGINGINNLSICDTAGKLQFYISQDKIFQSNDVQMPNGNNIISTFIESQIQILKHPSLDSQLIHFVIVNNNVTTLNKGLYYSIVDMNLNSGLGNVTTRKNIRIGGNLIFNQGIGIARHSNEKDWWIIVSLFKTDSVYAYLLNENGKINPPIISILKNNRARTSSNTHIRVCAQNNLISFCNTNDSHLFLCKFDNQTGLIKSQINIPIQNIYSSEFSYLGHFLYVNKLSNSGYDTLIQLKTNEFDSVKIAQSFFNLDTILTVSSNPQIGPDRKIYYSSGTFFLNEIQDPDQKGNACLIASNNQSMGTKTTGIPSMQLNYPWWYHRSRLYTDSNICINDTSEFRFFHNNYIDSFHFYFDDGKTERHKKEKTFLHHVYQRKGDYRPYIVSYYKQYIDTFYTQLKVIQNKPNLGPDLHFCKGYNLTVKSKSNFVNYNWNNVNNSDSFDVKDSNSQIILKTISINGCADSDTINVYRSVINPSMSVNDSIQCFNKVLIKAKNTTFVQNDAIKESNWFLDGIKIGTSDSINSYNLNIGKHPLLLRIITDSSCIDSFISNIYILPSPKTKINVNDSLQCLGGNYFIFTSFGSLKNLWSGDVNNANDSIIATKFNFPGNFKIKLNTIDKNQCTGEDSLTVKVFNPLQNKIIGAKDTFCEGDKIILTSRYPNLKTTWNTNFVGDSFEFKYTKSGNYQITLFSIDSNGCKSTDSSIIKIAAIPNPIVVIDNDYCNYTNTLINNTKDVSNKYWIYQNVKQFNSTLKITSKLLFDTVLLISITKEGCIDTLKITLQNDSISSTLLKIPNVFTPDNDGINDCYNIEGIKQSCGDNAAVEIFNRWGILVYKGPLGESCWNGQYLNNGELCPAGTYFAIFQIIQNGKSLMYNGTVTLIR